MSVFHDGCTAGPLSSFLNALIGACCDAHDTALDHSFDLATFARANWEFARCVWAFNPVLAVVVFLVVTGPLGLLMYYYGPKAPGLTGVSGGVAATPTPTSAENDLCEPAKVLESADSGGPGPRP